MGKKKGASAAEQKSIKSIYHGPHVIKALLFGSYQLDWAMKGIRTAKEKKILTYKSSLFIFRWGNICTMAPAVYNEQSSNGWHGKRSAQLSIASSYFFFFIDSWSFFIFNEKWTNQLCAEAAFVFKVPLNLKENVCHYSMNKCFPLFVFCFNHYHQAEFIYFSSCQDIFIRIVK